MSHFEGNGANSRSSRRSQLRDTNGPAADKSPRKRWVKTVAVVAIVAVIGSVIVGLFYSGVLSNDDYAGEGSGDVQFTISAGEYGDAIAINLAKADVVKSSKKFYTLLLNTNPEPVFVPGLYALKQHMSNAEALNALQDPANRIENVVVIPEGSTLKQTFAILSQKLSIPLADIQSAAANAQNYGVPSEANTLEGFLFPATYRFTPGVKAQDVLSMMVTQTLAALDKAGVSKADRWTTIILASIVQREMGPIPGDAAKISRVFHNRIDQGMLLGSDVTTCYGANLSGRDCLLISQAALDDKSNPYNTRVNSGLPIGPISNPGFVAINAAQNPAQGDWLFFVTVNLKTGETVFTTSNAEHEKAVEQYLQWLKENPNAY
jgi:UPF0755 protein